MSPTRRTKTRPNREPVAGWHLIKRLGKSRSCRVSRQALIPTRIEIDRLGLRARDVEIIVLSNVGAGAAERSHAVEVGRNLHQARRAAAGIDAGRQAIAYTGRRVSRRRIENEIALLVIPAVS